MPLVRSKEGTFIPAMLRVLAALLAPTWVASLCITLNASLTEFELVANASQAHLCVEPNKIIVLRAGNTSCFEQVSPCSRGTAIISDGGLGIAGMYNEHKCRTWSVEWNHTKLLHSVVNAGDFQKECSRLSSGTFQETAICSSPPCLTFNAGYDPTCAEPYDVCTNTSKCCGNAHCLPDGPGSPVNSCIPHIPTPPPPPKPPGPTCGPGNPCWRSSCSSDAQCQACGCSSCYGSGECGP